MAVYLFATLDTKGAEADFVRQLLVSYGVSVTLVDVGALGEPAVVADVHARPRLRARRVVARRRQARVPIEARR